jgi:hypothetical protein
LNLNTTKQKENNMKTAVTHQLERGKEGQKRGGGKRWTNTGSRDKKNKPSTK